MPRITITRDRLVVETHTYTIDTDDLTPEQQQLLADIGEEHAAETIAALDTITDDHSPDTEEHTVDDGTTIAPNYQITRH